MYLSHHGQIKFQYKVVHHEKDLSNLKVDPLRKGPKKVRIEIPHSQKFLEVWPHWGLNPGPLD